MLRIGLVGTGKLSQSFLAPAIQHVDGAVLWSVLSRDQRRADAFATLHGALSPNPGFSSEDQFLSDKSLDAVIIATPDGFHAKQSIAAARSGKHVFVEKPMANLEMLLLGKFPIRVAAFVVLVVATLVTLALLAAYMDWDFEEERKTCPQ